MLGSIPSPTESTPPQQTRARPARLSPSEPTQPRRTRTGHEAVTVRIRSCSTGGGETRSIGWRGWDGEEAGDASGAPPRRGGDVGAAVAVGQDGLLPRLHARVPAARLRAAAPRRPPRPPPPARAPLQLPPRLRRTQQLPTLLAPRPGQGVPLPLLPRRPPRRLRRPLPPHPLRVHGVRGRRGIPVGGGGVQRELPLLPPRQGCGRLRRAGRRQERRARAAGQGPARRRRGHVPHLVRARRRAPRHGLPGQQPREAPPARRLQNRHRSCEVKGSPYAQVAEAMHRMTTIGFLI